MSEARQHMVMINPHTGRPFAKDFFKDLASGQQCQIRIAAMEGLQCASRDTVVLCHISMAELKAMGKKLVPDILGAWGCQTCHDLVDGRRRSRRMTKEQLQLYHLEGVMRTQHQIRKLGYLP